MRTVVAGFEHRQGQHCGSTAMVDALRVVGVELTEELAIGLGSALHYLPLSVPGLSPSRMFMGRSPSFEQDLCTTIGVRFEERPFASFALAWQQSRRWILEDRPVLALTDLRYLPYYGTSTHFNGHRLVIAGFDEARGIALVADTHFAGLVEVAFDDLARALSSDAPPVTSTDCIVGVLDPPSQPLDLPGACRQALERSASAMLDGGPWSGVGALEKLGPTLLEWSEAKDWAWCARFAYQLIEKRGCGGGLFRRLYTGFLAQAAEADVEGVASLVPLGQAAADAWSALASELKEVSEMEAPDFSRAAQLADPIAEFERRLWEGARAAATR